ncbi:MAG: hypothetical protein KDB61_13800, partial [Planctomycetes bacterium]|nr:hypothetical protein [Planctomycetota bacterium]
MFGQTHIRVLVTFLVLCVATPLLAQTTVNLNPTGLPLAAYSYPMSGWVRWFGPESSGANWQTRKVLADTLDATMWTPNIQQHPLLDPELGPFVSLYHHARVWHGIDALAHDPAPTSGVRLGKWYSSGWSLQFRQPNGHNFTVMVDFSDGPFTPSPTTPNLVSVEVLQLDALANNIDAYFITHSHIDHVSPYLVSRMLQLGKLVVAPLEVKVQALLAGYPGASAIVAPT